MAKYEGGVAFGVAPHPPLHLAAAGMPTFGLLTVEIECPPSLCILSYLF